jgi:hypothetical protein
MQVRKGRSFFSRFTTFHPQTLSTALKILSPIPTGFLLPRRAFPSPEGLEASWGKNGGGEIERAGATTGFASGVGTQCVASVTGISTA